MKRVLALLVLCQLLACKGTKMGEMAKEGRDQVVKNAPMILVGVLLYPIGPLVTITGMVVTNVVTDVVESKASLSSGETLTEIQLKKEMKRWQDEAVIARGAASAASKARDWLYTVLTYTLAGIIAAGLIWLHWRNRHNWVRFGYRRGVWGHGLFGGKIGITERKSS